MTPGVRAMWIDTDRKVDVETNRHAVRPREFFAGGELGIGNPLDVFVEFDLCQVRLPEPFDGGAVRRSPRLRPFRPRFRHVHLPQHLEGGKAQQRLAMPLPEEFEVLTARMRSLRAEALVRETQGRHFRTRYRRIIDKLGLAKRRDLYLQPADIEFGKLWDRLHVDIERIYVEVAVWRILDRAFRPLRKERVQRIEADATRTESGRDRDEIGEVGEVTDAPVALRAHSVQLHC